MSQQIASLYASLGFNVDQSGLTAFRTEMQTLKKEFTEVLKDTANMNRRLKTLAGRLGQFNNLFNPQNITDWRKRLVTAIRHYSSVMYATRQQMVTFGQYVFDSERKLHWFENRLKSNINTLDTYRQHLEPVVLLLERLRGAAGSPLPRPSGGYGGGGSGQGTRHHTGQGGTSVGGGLLQAMGVGAFLRPMLPTGMGIGGMLGAGYGFRELVQAGREMQAMEMKLQAVSENAAVFNSNLEFVKKTSHDLALNVSEFGASYASIFQSAKRTAGVEQIQQMSEGMNKYFRTLQMTPEQIKGSLRAVSQMFNKEAVQAEELRGQLAERAAGVFEIFAKAAGTDVKGLQDLMKEGKVGSDIVLKAGVMMGEWADKQGTLSVALQQSAAKQEQFNNKLKEMSLLILKSGLDQALAALFGVLTPLVEIVGTGLAFVFKMLKGIYKTFKIFTDFAAENQLYTAIMLVGLAVSGLLLAFGRLAAVNTIVFFQMIANTIRLNALLWITRLRVLGIIGVFTYLLTQLDDFFVHGKEDNIFMTWYYTVQMLASELDLMFARLKYNMFMFKENPFDYTKSFFYDKRDDSQYSLPEKILRFFPNLVVDATKPIRDWREGLFTDTPAQAVQQNTPTPVNQNITVNIDASKTSPQVQSSIVNGNMDSFSKMVGTEVNNQMRLSPHR